MWHRRLAAVYPPNRVSCIFTLTPTPPCVNFSSVYRAYCSGHVPAGEKRGSSDNDPTEGDSRSLDNIVGLPDDQESKS